MIHVFAGHGVILYHMGQAEQAMDYFAKVRVPENHALQQSFEWFDSHPQTGSQLRIAKTLWVLGQPDQAKLLSDEAIAMNEVDDYWQGRFSILDFSGMLYSFLRDADTVLQLGEALLELGMEYDYPFYQRAGQMFIGWALAHKGDAKTGAKQVRDSVDGHRDRGIRTFKPYWRALLAEALALAEETGEALYLKDARALLEQLQLRSIGGERYLR